MTCQYQLRQGDLRWDASSWQSAVRPEGAVPYDPISIFGRLLCLCPVTLQRAATMDGRFYNRICSQDRIIDVAVAVCGL
jgi:hypothetical protein